MAVIQPQLAIHTGGGHESGAEPNNRLFFSNWDPDPELYIFQKSESDPDL